MPDVPDIATLGAQNLLFLLPELIVTVGILIVLAFTAAFPRKTRSENASLMVVSLATTLVALAALFWEAKNGGSLQGIVRQVMYGTLSADQFSYLLKSLLLVGAGITIAISQNFLERRTRIISDFYVLILGATLGGMVLTSATDLVVAFVGLETLSITSYILAGYLRKTSASTEASFKYLVYGGMGTAVFLFGLSLIYGFTGATDFAHITPAMASLQGVAHPTLILSMVMVFAALAYKLSVAPFHMWAPDVYEGAPTPVSAFLSVVSKTAAFAFTIRLFLSVFSFVPQWSLLFTILAIVSMVVGNFIALRQTNVKRLLAYSTVAQAGYMMLAFTVGSAASFAGLLYYLITYLFMNLGAFACVIKFSTVTGSDRAASYAGLVRKRPLLTFAFSIFLLSLAGIPITSGFFAKFFLFQNVMQSAGVGTTWLIIVALLNSAVSLAYYVNLIRLMVVSDSSAEVDALPHSSPPQWSLSTALILCLAMTLGLGIYATPFLQASTSAVGQLMENQVKMLSDAR